jgi:hypothetical protein
MALMPTRLKIDAHLHCRDTQDLLKETAHLGCILAIT